MNNPVGDADYIFKVIVIGDSGVGKSSLTVRLSEDVFFNEHCSTVALDFRLCHMVVPGDGAQNQNRKIKLQIWDTAGQERFLSVSTAFYRGANGVLLCFDLTNRQSFERLDVWLERVRMQAMPGVPVVVVGCKNDEVKARKVSADEAQAWASKQKFGYVETSAKAKENVHESFQMLVMKILEDAKKSSASSAAGGGGVKQPGQRSVGTVSLSQPPPRPGHGPGAGNRGAQQPQNDCSC